MFYKETWRSVRNLEVNPVIKVLILSDFLIWSSCNLIAPIFAVFILDHIDNGSLEAVGLATTIFFICKAIFEVPVGMYIDKSKSEKDDLYFAVIGTLLYGLCYLFFPSVTQVWQVYLLQGISGLACAICFPGWYSIFTRHIDKEKAGFEWSLHDVLLGVGIAACAAIGAFLAEQFGFDAVFYVVGAMVIAGAFLLVTIKNRIYLQ